MLTTSRTKNTHYATSRPLRIDHRIEQAGEVEREVTGILRKVEVAALVAPVERFICLPLVPYTMTLDELLDWCEEEYDIERSEEAAEVGRTMAGLQD